jgi:DNA-binding response OmpR family regulator
MSTPHPLTILVVEDDLATRQTVMDILELNGFRGIRACDGVEGLELARRERPAAVIVDLKLPRLSGYDLIQELRQDETLGSTPVVVITAHADRYEGGRAQDLGADDLITKPFAEETLVLSLRRRLEEKHAPAARPAPARGVARENSGSSP